MRRFAFALVLLGGITSVAWGEQSLVNPPPATKLADFGKFELRRVVMRGAGSAGATIAIQRLDGHLAASINPLIAKWKTDSRGARSLMIQPEVIDVRYVSEKVRSWGGQFTGDSFVTLRLKLTDAKNGELIAEPEFYQRTSMANGATKNGVADRNMLRLVARMAASYLEQNHDAAIGGPTGRQ